MQLRKIAALVAIPVVAVAALSACGGGGKGNAGSGGSISIGIAEPKHLTPTNTNDTSGSQVLNALFTGLVETDQKTNEPVLAAAESIETADSKVWTIKLKSGWTFHNGEAVTADNYLLAWNYGAYGPNGQGNNEFFQKIAGFEALNPKDKNATPSTKALTGLEKVDDLTFKVTLKDPFSAFKAMLGYTAFYPIPKAAEADMKAFEDAPIGNGPFKIDGKWDHDKSVKTVAFDAYTGRQPKVKAIEFRIYQQPTAMYADLLGGNLDVVTSIPTESLATAKSDLAERFKTSPNSSITFLGYPMYDPKFAKPEVRMALSMAIDREEINQKIFAGTRKPADSFISPIVPGYTAGAGGAGVTFAPEKAKALLESAGGLLGGTLNITYNVDGGHKEWVEAVCNQLSKNLGIKCTATPEPKFADLLKKAEAKDPALGLIRMGWVADYPDPGNYEGPLYTTDGSSNYYGYSNPAFDALVAEGDRAATREEAFKKYAEAQALLAKDMPVIPLFYGQNVYGHSSNVQNVCVEASTHVDLYQIDTK